MTPGHRDRERSAQDGRLGSLMPSRFPTLFPCSRAERLEFMYKGGPGAGGDFGGAGPATGGAGAATGGAAAAAPAQKPPPQPAAPAMTAGTAQTKSNPVYPFLASQQGSREAKQR